MNKEEWLEYFRLINDREPNPQEQLDALEKGEYSVQKKKTSTIKKSMLQVQKNDEFKNKNKTSSTYKKVTLVLIGILMIFGVIVFFMNKNRKPNIDDFAGEWETNKIVDNSGISQSIRDTKELKIKVFEDKERLNFVYPVEGDSYNNITEGVDTYNLTNDFSGFQNFYKKAVIYSYKGNDKLVDKSEPEYEELKSIDDYNDIFKKEKIKNIKKMDDIFYSRQNSRNGQLISFYIYDGGNKIMLLSPFKSEKSYKIMKRKSKKVSNSLIEKSNTATKKMLIKREKDIENINGIWKLSDETNFSDGYETETNSLISIDTDTFANMIYMESNNHPLFGYLMDYDDFIVSNFQSYQTENLNKDSFDKKSKELLFKKILIKQGIKIDDLDRLYFTNELCLYISNDGNKLYEFSTYEGEGENKYSSLVFEKISSDTKSTEFTSNEESSSKGLG